MTNSEKPNEHIHQNTIVSQVMEKIKALIASGQFKPGDRIPTEQELATRFGIGRSSIREAIKIFNHLGVLESRVPKGTFVCSSSSISTEAITWAILLGNNDMYEIIELRQAIEAQGFVILVKNFAEGEIGTDEVLAALEAEISGMVAAAREGSVDKLIISDFRFHELIVKQSKNRLFVEIFQTLHQFTQEEIRKTYVSMANLNEVSADHREILDTIRTQDADASIKRHGAHFNRIKTLLQ